jgi:hypothetical protein
MVWLQLRFASQAWARGAAVLRLDKENLWRGECGDA